MPPHTRTHPGTSVPGSPGPVCCVCVVGDWRAVWCDQASRGRQPTGVGFLCVCLCFVDWRHPCCRTHAHTRALPYPARQARGVVCVLLAIGELCGVFRRAVGGSPRVSGFFACVCVFVDWRHPCRRTHAHTRALPCPARLARGGDLFDVNAGPDVRNWHFLSPAAGHPRLRCA